VITLTQNAAQALLSLIREKSLGENSGLRLAVEKGGCAGLQYSMTIGEPLPDDEIVSGFGARVFVDPASAEVLAGCVVDYEDSLSGAGFRVKNPNAVRSCGCGTSFEPAPHAE
jgi:iron-sulfur cluster assembly protein